MPLLLGTIPSDEELNEPVFLKQGLLECISLAKPSEAAVPNEATSDMLTRCNLKFSQGLIKDHFQVVTEPCDDLN